MGAKKLGAAPTVTMWFDQSRLDVSLAFLLIMLYEDMGKMSKNFNHFTV